MQRVNGSRFISNVFQRFVLYSTSTSTNCFANYLVDSLGFTHQQALSTSTKLSQYRKVNDFIFDSNAISVVTLFNSHGFDDTHIKKIVSFDPRMLTCNVENTLRPKFKFFHDQGFSMLDIIRVITANPQLLVSGVESCILPSIQILRKILVCDTQVIAVVEKLHHRAFARIIKCLQPNIDLLSSYGIPIELIRKHLLLKPGSFMRDSELFKDIVIKVEKKLGISPESLMFLYGIHLLSGRSEETIESKFRMFKSFGWTQSDVETLMITHACCFQFSDATIKKKLDFLMNEVRLKPAYLISHTCMLTYGLEKRVVPRHKVLVILKEKGLFKKYPSLFTAVRMSEPSFLKRFVLPFKEVHQVYAEHTGCSMEMLTQESAHDLT